jgi:hypothetical protein
MKHMLDHVLARKVRVPLYVAADVPEGGETAFPDSDYWVDRSLPEKLGPFSPCARGAVAFKPRKVGCATSTRMAA